MVKMCTFCVMDDTADNITYNEHGQCNYCRGYLNRVDEYESCKSKLAEFTNTVKISAKGKKYDCIVGLSGGLDSSYALLQVVNLGLKPLAVHMDNGWNSELATNNIKNLVTKLDVDLYTHVIDWIEYRQLMQAFFDADVLDIELLYDNAMMSVNYRLAKKYGIKYILAGSNHATEGVAVPKSWNWFKYDKRNIFAIAKKFSKVKIKSMPTMGVFDYIRYRFLRKILWIPFLDYFDYNKEKALKILIADFNYKPYPYKHYESIFTRFYQGYILPNKFNVDKRKLHLSSLICSRQISRDEALKVLENIPYPSEEDLDRDISYFLKKMEWSTEDLKDYINRPEVKHEKYDTEVHLWNKILSLKNKLKNSQKG